MPSWTAQIKLYLYMAFLSALYATHLFLSQPCRSFTENQTGTLTPVHIDSTTPMATLAEAEPDHNLPSDLPFGVNVWGWQLHHPYGLVEATLGVIRSLEVANIPFFVNDVYTPPVKPGVNTTAATSVVISAPFFFNLWSIVFTESTKLSQKYHKFFKNRYNLALWYWELEVPPTEAYSAFPIFDQIWTASDFAGKAFRNASILSHVPVRTQCVALLLDSITHKVPSPQESLPIRRKFGISEKQFLFFFAYDYESIGDRKNPLALVTAFRIAFGSSTNATLLLKTKAPRSSEAKAMHTQLEEYSKGLQVKIITTILPFEEMEQLYAAADCYVSLHRSEGFGNGIAYAMALGKPVIATNYSAPSEYMTEVNSYPVKWNYTKIKRKTYIFPVGAEWASPDVVHAAERMQQVYNNPQEAMSRGTLARQTILGRYLPEVCGKHIKEELTFLYKHRALLRRYVDARLT